MAPREDLIQSAVTFLQDPSVAQAPIEQRRSFLQSKNLTSEEISLALARAGENPIAQQYAQPPQSSYYSERQAPPAYGYNYGSYPPHNPWPQQPAQRDWRDWFIMATVTSGLGWGLYTVAKRYITPLIIPPTPPQIESDKAAIDASFTRAFDLIEQLSTDTAALKAAEAERKEKLDTALEEVNTVVADLREVNRKREEESKRLSDEVRNLRELIPRSLEGWKRQGDDRIKDLSSELKSLKTLVSGRIGGASNTSSVSGSTAPAPAVNGTSSTTSGSEETLTATSASSSTVTAPSVAPAPAPGITTSRSPNNTPTPFSFEGRTTGRAIPAWQMAAASKTPAADTSLGNLEPPADVVEPSLAQRPETQDSSQDARSSHQGIPHARHDSGYSDRYRSSRSSSTASSSTVIAMPAGPTNQPTARSSPAQSTIASPSTAVTPMPAGPVARSPPPLSTVAPSSTAVTPMPATSSSQTVAESSPASSTMASSSTAITAIPATPSTQPAAGYSPGPSSIASSSTAVTATSAGHIEQPAFTFPPVAPTTAPGPRRQVPRSTSSPSLFVQRRVTFAVPRIMPLTPIHPPSRPDRSGQMEHPFGIRPSSLGSASTQTSPSSYRRHRRQRAISSPPSTPQMQPAFLPPAEPGRQYHYRRIQPLDGTLGWNAGNPML